MKRARGFSIESIIVCIASATTQAGSVGTAFTYQGQLKQDGLPLSDFIDFRFSLWNAAGAGTPPSGGSQVGSSFNTTNVKVDNGLFTVQVDFGVNIFDGQALWLQIAFRRSAGSINPYVTLGPRQPVTPAPYAQFAIEADTLDGIDSTELLTQLPVPLDVAGVEAGGYVVRGTNSATDAGSVGIRGRSRAFTGETIGVEGESFSEDGTGVLGLGSSAIGTTFGVVGQADSSSGTGVRGWHANSGGTSPGVLGETDSSTANAVGVLGRVNSTGAGSNSSGVRGVNFSLNSNGYGVNGEHAGGGTGVRGVSQTGIGVLGTHSAATGTGAGVSAETHSTTSNANAILGTVIPTNPGGFSTAVRGVNNGTGGNGIGVWGSQNGGGYGVFGTAETGTGVYGKANDPGGTGVRAEGNGTSSTALAVASGAIKVPGAGVNTNTAAFVHEVTNGNQSNCTLPGIACYDTIIDNAYCNNDPNAMIFITARSPAPASVFVYYDTDTGRWILESNVTLTYMNVGNQFNVLVIKP